MREPEGKGQPENWPADYDPAYAAPIRRQLTEILEAARDWAAGTKPETLETQS